MGQVQALLMTMFEQGFLFAFLGLGVLVTFRFFRFPDLTAEGSYPLGGAVVATMLVSGANPFVATACAMIAGVAAGIVTALVHTKLRINNIISGIVVMTALYTVNLRTMGRSNIGLLDTPTVFSDALAVPNLLGFSLAESKLSTIATTLVLLLAVSLLLIWFFKTDLGLAVRATGQNETMIESLGVDLDKTKMIGLALSNGLVALSGALIAQNHAFADIGMGTGILVAGAAAVLIGEALFGDRGIAWWVIAAIVGSLVFQFLTAAALRFGLSPNDLKLVTAALLLAALALPRLRLRMVAK